MGQTARRTPSSLRVNAQQQRGGWTIDTEDDEELAFATDRALAYQFAAAPEQHKALVRLMRAAATISNLQHAGVAIDNHAWSELYAAINEARAATAKAKPE